MASFNVGSLYLRNGDPERAHSAFISAIKRDPGLAVAMDGLGSAYSKRGDVKTAQAMFKRALGLQPDIAESYFNLATIERQRGNWFTARDYLESASRSVARGSSDPMLFWSQVYNNLGGALHALAKYPDAVARFDQAIELAPNMVMAYVNKGETLRVQGLWDDAMVHTRIAIALAASHGVALSNHIMYAQNVCDWRDIDRHFATLSTQLQNQDVTQTDPSDEATPTVSPYQAVTFPFSPSQTMSLLKAYADDISRKSSRIKNLITLAPPPQVADGPGGRLRVAYMSSDFGEHTTGENVAGIFSLHKRERYHMFAYATSPSDASAARLTIEADAETFRDVSQLSTAQLAFAINAEGIHILVDFNGHTLGARSHVTSLRPAPITMFDQGFAGSSGGVATHFNADRVSLPPEYAHFHTERITYMPHFSNPLNNHRVGSKLLAETAAEFQGRHAEIGVPQNKFLYACFNTGYKYDSQVLDSWARILKSNPESSLWLLKWPGMKKHISREARARGLSNESIVFTEIFPKSSHLSWKSLANLFLDTTAFNGHGTLSQMLWMAVPTITLPLERIGQRIGAAVVLASAVPELVALTREDYVDMAAGLGGANGRRALARARDRLIEGRWDGEKSPLFDIAGYVGDYERMLAALWDSFQHSAEHTALFDGGRSSAGIIHETFHWKLGHVVVSDKARDDSHVP